MNLSSGITSILVSATAIVMVQADTMVARGMEASEIKNIAEKITVIIVSKDPIRPNKIVFRGSGVIFKRKGNSYYVLTNAHVVRTDESYQIRGPARNSSERKTYNAKLIRKDTELDLAILEFTSSRDYSVAKLGNDASLSQNSSVYVMGWINLGEEARRVFREGRIRELFQNLLRYTNRTEPGMSGGPVLNYRGQLVGIHKSRSEGNQGGGEGISMGTIMGLINSVGIGDRVPSRPAEPSEQLPRCDRVLWGPCR